MNILIASDSFKGTMSSVQIMEKLAEAANAHLHCDVAKIAIADGGEGTVEALVSNCGGNIISSEVTGPLFQKVTAQYGITSEDTAIIEMAQASGLALASLDKNPLNTTSYGTGELIKGALERGYRKILIGLGGSATNDGGIGAMMALGAKFYDQDNHLITAGTGAKLQNICAIDVSQMHPLIQDCEIKVICDVNNPLLGETGATYVFGPQKGADANKLEILEAGMTNYAKVVSRDLQQAFENVPGAGAAGGLGYALITFLGAELVRGVDAILDLVQFDKLMKNVDLVITGEGNMDGQSLYGKVPIGVAKRCEQFGVPVIAVVGGMDESATAVYEHGIAAVFPILPKAMPLEEALQQSEDVFDAAADRLFRLIKAILSIKSRRL